MDARQIELVQASFAKVVPIADQAAVIFYDELFKLDPSLRALFADDLTEQRAKLMKMLGTAVNGLRDWDVIQPAVASLGARHVGYGVTATHYSTVGAALLSTLEKGLGDAFTPQVRAAWAEVYQALSSTMIAAEKLPA
ncbi:MAG TPA: globin family protein [Flexivirga sp.]|uniref:globin family protein n=1 Tax=Flexivirga sp. TaxID=1962927 RepID=UPI002C6B50E5|nr:globin family protein [Flexivirga sp.]HWC24289.1 globin family protein [Flexivirga sp.]